jgi:hypothetical protein
MNKERLIARKERLEQALSEGHPSPERIAEWTAALDAINTELGGVLVESFVVEKDGDNKIGVPIAKMELKS